MGLLSRLAFWKKNPSQAEAALARLDATPQEAEAAIRLIRAYDSQEYRERMGRALNEQAFGVRQNQVDVKIRWEPADIEAVLRDNESGSFYRLGLLLDAMRWDGMISGIMETRTSGLLRLPVQMTGDPLLLDALRGESAEYDDVGNLIRPGIEGEFWRLFPETELSAIIWDGILAGFGLGEFVPAQGGQPERLRHLDLHWVRYDHSSDTWSYQSPTSQWLIRPEDGRWFFFRPYGERRPWAKGKWSAIAFPFVRKLESGFDRIRWQKTLGDALRWIEANEKSHEDHYDELRRFLRYGWGRGGGIVLRPGEKAGLTESQGRGYEAYRQTIEDEDLQIQIALAGQTVTVTGTSGFSNGNIWRDIAGGLIQDTAEKLATTIHHQKLVHWARTDYQRPGDIWVRWDVRSPEQKQADAKAIGDISDSVAKADVMFAARGKRVDEAALLDQAGFAIPTVDLVQHPTSQKEAS